MVQLKEDDIFEHDLDLFNRRFIVLQFARKYLEMYQMKIFYYQQIPGIREFRLSMSQTKSYLYYPNNELKTFEDFIKDGASLEDIYRVLEQIKTIIDNGESYLLYKQDFILKSDWILVDKNESQLKVELLYIPLKPNKEINVFNQLKLEYEKGFIKNLAHSFNQIGYMEGYYYFTRLHDLINDSLNIYTEISKFLQLRGHDEIIKR